MYIYRCPIFSKEICNDSAFVYQNTMKAQTVIDNQDKIQ